MTGQTQNEPDASGGEAALPLQSIRVTAVKYLVALLAVGIAFGVRLALEPFLEDQARFLFCIPAVLVASAVGGAGPGIVATVLSLLIAVPHYDFATMTFATRLDAGAFPRHRPRHRAGRRIPS
jgi:K+-sensing histidine kinase KdpD